MMTSRPKYPFKTLHFQFIEGSVNLSEVQCSQLRNNRPIKCSLFFATGQAAIFWTRQHNLGRWVVKIRGLASCETFQTHSLPRDSTLLVLHTRRWRALNMCEKIQFCCLRKKLRLGPQTAILPINDLFRPIFAQTKTKMFWSFLLAFLNHLVPFETKNSMLKRSIGVFYMSGYQKFLSPIT